MNNWVENIKAVSTGLQSGVCPMCGGSKTEFKYTIIDKPDGFLKIWCNECGAKVVIDCIVPEQAIALAG